MSDKVVPRRPGNLDVLPKWAQRYIEKLEDVADAQEKLLVGEAFELSTLEPGFAIEVRLGQAEWGYVPVSNLERVVFVDDERRRVRLKVDRVPRHGEEIMPTVMTITGADRLLVMPRSDNQVSISPWYER